ADAQRADLAARRAPCRLNGALGLRQGGARLGEEQAAGLGELDAAPVALQELGSELALDRLYLERQRRLADIQPLRRAGEMQLLGQHHEIAELPEVHGLYAALYKRRPIIY